eukprot:3660038-Amphidinium_carterae.1
MSKNRCCQSISDRGNTLGVTQYHKVRRAYFHPAGTSTKEHASQKPVEMGASAALRRRPAKS